MRRDDALANCQTEATATRLGREEGLEHLIEFFLWKTRPGVRHFDTQELLAAGTLLNPEIRLHACRNGEDPSRGHRFQRVLHQVQKKVNELSLITPGVRQAGIDLKFYGNASMH